MASFPSLDTRGYRTVSPWEGCDRRAAAYEERFRHHPISFALVWSR